MQKVRLTQILPQPTGFVSQPAQLAKGTLDLFYIFQRHLHTSELKDYSKECGPGYDAVESFFSKAGLSEKQNLNSNLPSFS